ncbi:uncharacterized protein LOC123864949 [Maniola jurtina]|uniref:uncharacterized protein LOC123864949 n=1 Tax=Maniola jurtina TaxID=191418 RepID=UPI001E68E5B9|nr:uncharacterized protein LOC123864949 [Maniola jurtina]
MDKMCTVATLITLFSIQAVKSMSVQKSYLMDKSDPENEITDFIYSKGYLPNQNELPKPTVIKSADDDVTYLLSKLSDGELVKLLNDHPKKKIYGLDDIVKLALGDKSDNDRKISFLGRDIQEEADLQNINSNTAYKRFRINSGIENDQRAHFKLNHKPIDAKKQKNELNFLALMKLHDFLNYRPEHVEEDLSEEKRELLFDILVSQLKSLCCKSNKRVRNLQVSSKSLSNIPKEKLYSEFNTSNVQKSNEFMFLIVNDEIKSKSNDDLILVDPETLEKNSSILLLGPITAPLTDGQLKVIMDRISNELSKPEYTSLLQQLSDGSLSASNTSLMKNFIFGHETRRYIKPHRCNYQSKLAKIYGGPRWLICTGYLNLNTPSLYD